MIATTSPINHNESMNSIKEPTVPQEDVPKPIKVRHTRYFLEVTAIFDNVSTYIPLREFPQPLQAIRSAFDATTALQTSNVIYGIKMNGTEGCLKPTAVSLPVGFVSY